VVTELPYRSISATAALQLAPVTPAVIQAFVRVRPKADLKFAGSVATVGNAAGEKATSDGRCPR
jgi:hypothetical protein